MSNLDVPAFAVGLTGLVALVDKSLIIWKSFAESREFGNDMLDLSIRLSIEYYRYQDWANATGSLWMRDNHAQPAAAGHQSRPDVFTSLGAAVEGAVGQIIRIILDISEISAKYGTNANLARRPAAVPGGGTAYQQNQAKNLQNDTPFHLRFAFSSKPWGASDKEALKEKIASLSQYNTSLEALLPKPIRESLGQQGLPSHLLATENREILKSLVEASNHESESVHLHAQLLQERLDYASRRDYGQFSVDKYRQEASAVSKIHGLSASTCALSLQLLEISGSIPAPVAIEWQSFESMQWEHEDFTIAARRLSELVHLSSLSERPKSLLTLHGVCYVEKEGSLALVHHLPSDASTTAQPLSLHNLLEKVVKRFRAPDLNLRLHLAQQLASSIHSFGLVRWFHKDFNSHNVAFFRSKHDPNEILFSSPYVVGLSVSRPNKDGEKSLNKDQDAVSIYLHPDLRVAASERRPSYHRKYDIYSLGLVLFEIGAWRPLETIAKPSLSPLDFKAALVDRCKKDLGFYCGPQYRDAVLHCLTCADEEIDETESAFDKLYWAVVLEIAKLC